ncbi:putative gustatory receptor 28a [Schistocerca piceifrons]|uniref:putative gustatory receptor 28a n=1 Tax=Schistocerca piceifrons TaxID=274613 RepID=UPI001F5EFB13|nr:putative gustatory receptor 28a [Schistocerca piceifrons]
MMVDNLFGAVKPLYYLSRIFGLAPFSFNPKTSKFTCALYDRIYPLVLVTAAFVLGVLATTERDEATHFIPTVDLNDMIEIVMVTSSGTLILLKWFLSNYKIVKDILNKIIEIDEVLLTDSVAEFRKIFRILMVEIAVLVPALLFLFVCDSWTWKESMKIFDLYYFAAPYPYYTVVVMSETQFFNLVLLLKSRYARVNQRLRSVWQRAESASFLNRSTPWTDMVATTDDGRPSRRLFIDTVMRQAKNVDDSGEVHLLRQVHGQLFDTAGLVNEAFGLPVLSAVAAHFIHCVSLLNLILALKLQYQPIPPSQVDLLMLNLMIWVVLHVSCVLAVTWCCSSAVAEARQTAVLVHKALLPNAGAGAAGAQLRDQLQLFSQQLLHHRLRFTAAGVFTVDLTILLSMAGAITTYLVIYLQFNDTKNI